MCDKKVSVEKSCTLDDVGERSGRQRLVNPNSGGREVGETWSP